jgi:hypothetical protein
VRLSVLFRHSVSKVCANAEHRSGDCAATGVDGNPGNSRVSGA